MGNLSLISIKPSAKPDKKLDAIFRNKETGREKLISFGARGMDDYTKTHDADQRARYLERHGRGAEDWNKPDTAGSLSRWILWGPSTSQRENIRRFISRFSL